MLRNPFFLFAVLILIGFTSCDDDDDTFTGPIVGSGNMVSEDRNLANFNEVNVSDDIDVNLTAGVSFGVKVSTDDNLVRNVITEVNGNVLNIRRQVGPNYGEVDMTVDVTLPLLRTIRANNAADVSFSGFQDTANDLLIDANNASEVEGSNTTTRGLNITLNNASEADLYGVTAPTASVNLSNKSELEVAVTDRISGTVVNNSTLTYRNDPNVADVKTSGGGTVKKAN